MVKLCCQKNLIWVRKHANNIVFFIQINIGKNAD